MVAGIVIAIILAPLLLELTRRWRNRCLPGLVVAVAAIWKT